MPLLMLTAENSSIDKYYLRMCITSNQDLGEERLGGWLRALGSRKTYQQTQQMKGLSLLT